MLRALRNWFGGKRPSKAPSKARVRPARRLGLEALEDRVMLTASPVPGFHLDSGNLYIDRATGPVLIDTNVVKIAAGAGGSVYDLKGGNVNRYNGVNWSTIGTGVQGLFQGKDATGAAVAYEWQGGRLFQDVAGQWKDIGGADKVVEDRSGGVFFTERYDAGRAVMLRATGNAQGRSEERRVGKEC